MKASPLLIYLPGKSGVDDKAHLAAAGLGHLTRNRPQAYCTDVLQGGPDGGRGLLISFGGTVGVQLETQRWRPAIAAGELAAGRYWVGLPKGPVHPDELKRPKFTPAEAVQGADGYLWGVPIATALPHDNRLGEAGLERVVAAEFQEYYALAEQFFAAFLNRGRGGLKMQDAWRLAVLGLQINYLVTPEVLDELGCLRSDDTLFDCGCSTFDLQLVLHLKRQKKPPSSTLAG